MHSLKQFIVAAGLMLAPPAPDVRAEFDGAARETTQQETTGAVAMPNVSRALMAQAVAGMLKDHVDLAQILTSHNMTCAGNIGGTLQALTAEESDPRIRYLIATYERAKRLPHFDEFQPFKENMPSHDIVCQSDKPISDKGSTANYWVHQDSTTLYMLFAPYLEAIIMLHERAHRARNQAYSYRRMEQELPFGEDLAFNSLIDEANAYTREYVAAYVMKLRGEPDYWDALGNKDERKDHIVQAASLLDPDELRDYAAKTGFLPPLLARQIFVGVAMKFHERGYYYDTHKIFLDKKPKGFSLKDKFVADSTSYDGYAYLADAKGIMNYMKRQSPAGYRLRASTSYDSDAARIELAQANGADFRPVIGRLAELLSAVRAADIPEPEAFLMAAFNKAKRGGELNTLFVLDDLKTFGRLFMEGLERHPDRFDAPALAGRRRAGQAYLDGLEAHRIMLSHLEKAPAPQKPKCWDYPLPFTRALGIGNPPCG